MHFAEQMLAAIHAVHSFGIMHCDLKPQNLVVVPVAPLPADVPAAGEPRPTHVLKICDFGVARQMDGLATHLSEDIGWGTAKYMAPEMVHSFGQDDKLRVDFAVDMWAFGVGSYVKILTC